MIAPNPMLYVNVEIESYQLGYQSAYMLKPRKRKGKKKSKVKF